MFIRKFTIFIYYYKHTKFFIVNLKNIFLKKLIFKNIYINLYQINENQYIESKSAKIIKDKKTIKQYI